jgi:hypothetical protein
MAKARWLAGLLVAVAACGKRAAPPTAAPPDAMVTPSDAAPADAAPLDPCDRMRREADLSDDDWPATRMRGLEATLRSFYRQHVAVSKEERRRARRLVFESRGVAPGARVGPCIADWRTSDPTGVVAAAPGAVATDHRYVEAILHFDDDGSDFIYTFFVDVDTFEIAGAFSDLVVTP